MLVAERLLERKADRNGVEWCGFLVLLAPKGGEGKTYAIAYGGLHAEGE